MVKPSSNSCEKILDLHKVYMLMKKKNHAQQALNVSSSDFAYQFGCPLVSKPTDSRLQPIKWTKCQKKKAKINTGNI